MYLGDLIAEGHNVCEDLAGLLYDCETGENLAVFVDSVNNSVDYSDMLLL